MTGPAYGIRLTVDATGSKEGRDIHVRSIEDIKRANASLTGSLQQQSAAVQQVVAAQRATVTTSAAVQQVTGATVGTYEQARAALEKMGVSANQMSAALKAMGFEQQAAAAATAKAAQAQVIASSAAVTAVNGHHKLTSAAQALAFSMTGLPGPIGRVAGALGAFAVGGGVTLAVTAGIGLIVTAYQALTQEARDAKRATDDLVQSLADAFDERTGVARRQQELQVTTALAQAQQGNAELRPGEGWVRVVDEKEVARATKAVLEFYERVRDENRKTQEAKARADAEEAARRKRLHDEEMQRLSEMGAERLRIMRELTTEGGVQTGVLGFGNTALYERLRASAQRQHVLNQPLQLDDRTLPATSEAYRKLAEEMERARQERIHEIDAIAQSRQTLVGLVEKLGLLPRELTDSANAAVEMARSAKLMKEGVKGAADSFALAGASIAVSLISGSRQRAQQNYDAFRAFIDEREGFGARQSAFIAQGSGQSETDRALNALREQFETLRRDAERLKLPTDALTASYEAQRQQIIDSAEALRLETEARKAEAEVMKAQEELRKSFDRQGRWASIDEARADLAGDPAGIARARLNAQIIGVNSQYATGAIGKDEWEAWLDIFAKQFDQAMQKIADDAAAATQALRDYNQAQQASLAVQALGYQATIDGTVASQQAYEDAERELRQENRLNELRKNGADEATIASQIYVDTLEDQATATRRAREEEKRLAEEREAALRFTQDLRVRELQATGQGAAADDLAFLNRQSEEYQRAVNDGRTPEQLADLARVQGLERIYRDDQRRAQQAEAYNNAMNANFSVTSPSFGAESATSVNLAVGTSESTSNRLAGLMGSQLAIQQAHLNLHTETNRLLRELVQLARRGAGLSSASLDELLGTAADDADLAAGYPPRNR